MHSYAAITRLTQISKRQVDEAAVATLRFIKAYAGESTLAEVIPQYKTVMDALDVQS
jgi:hypothetical protein